MISFIIIVLVIKSIDGKLDGWIVFIFLFFLGYR